MGLGLITMAEFHAERTGIGHAAARLLMRMCRVAYDDDNPKGIEPRRYFESRSAMAFAMGLSMPAKKPGADASKQERDRWTAGNSRVKRALDELIRAGAIVRTYAGSPGSNAEFRITVSAVDPADLGPLTDHLWGPVSGPDGDRSPISTGTDHRSPEHERPRAPQNPARNHLPALTHLRSGIDAGAGESELS